ncbi:MAG: hypothetical protein R3B68_14485 [Phycisphaerales bacterium]
MSGDRSKWQAADYAAVADWPGYFAAVSGKPARETLVAALDAFDAEGPTRFPRAAVDLGAGEGRDTAELLRRGWRVEAIDAHPDAIKRIWARTDLVNTDRLRTSAGTYEECFVPPCDLLNASFSLPFCHPAYYAAVWRKIEGAVRAGGRFAGQFFGDRDTWASIEGRSHHTEEQVRALLADWSVEYWRMEESDKPDAMGNVKHWHLFHVVARKTPGPTPRKTP